MISYKVDQEGFQNRLRMIQKDLGTKSARACALAMVGEFRDRMARMAPRDTNRYLRGWMDACAKAGVVSPLPVIRASSRQAEFLAALEGQLEWWTNLLNRKLAQRKARYEDHPDRKRGTAFRALNSQIKKTQRRVNVAKRELERAIGSGDGFLLIDGGWQALRGQFRPESTNPFGKRAITVRFKVYGGRGRVWLHKGKAHVQLVNLEPHSSILEAKTRVAAAAMSGISRGGATIKAGRAAMKPLMRLGVRPVA